MLWDESKRNIVSFKQDVRVFKARLERHKKTWGSSKDTAWSCWENGIFMEMQACVHFSPS